MPRTNPLSTLCGADNGKKLCFSSVPITHLRQAGKRLFLLGFIFFMIFFIPRDFARLYTIISHHIPLSLGHHQPTFHAHRDPMGESSWSHKEVSWLLPVLAFKVPFGHICSNNTSKCWALPNPCCVKEHLCSTTCSVKGRSKSTGTWCENKFGIVWVISAYHHSSQAMLVCRLPSSYSAWLSAAGKGTARWNTNIWLQLLQGEAWGKILSKHLHANCRLLN